MKLTPLKIAITTYSPEDIEKLHEYEESLSEISDSIVRSTRQKPDLPKPEYKNKWYAMDQYIILNWAADWDTSQEVPIIIASLFCVVTSSYEVINAQYTESEWKKLLSGLGYAHDEI